ncbi:MAG: ECF transporter S component, partial [Solobacterium sp.]|nr:ECF transporter S component [Solobacterium sp.]
MNQNLRNLTVAGLCLALCIVLPFITGNIPQIGQALSPMHIPVLVCGFLAGPAYGAVVGFIGPLLRSVMFGMPPMMRAIPMAFELCAYGAISGTIYKMLPKNMINVYVALIAAMLGGRAVWGIAS